MMPRFLDMPGPDNGKWTDGYRPSQSQNFRGLPLALSFSMFWIASMMLEADAHCGAGLHERNPGRVIRRDGSRERPFEMALGTLESKIPKPRSGSYCLRQTPVVSPTIVRIRPPPRGAQHLDDGYLVWAACPIKMDRMAPAWNKG